MEVLVYVVDPDDAAPDGLDVVPIDYEVDAPTVGVFVDTTSDDVWEALTEARSVAAALGGRITRVLARDPIPPMDEPALLARPMVGVSEFGDMKGISRQHASQVSQKAGFPLPSTILKAGPVWEMLDVARWIRDSQRSGRGRTARGRRRT